MKQFRWYKYLKNILLIYEKDKKQAEAELGQAQLNWKLGFAEAGAELDNKSSS